MTSFKNVPLDITGSAYFNRSTSHSAQTCMNLYTEVLPTGKTVKAMHSWPWGAAFSASTGTKGRGTARYKNELYQVAGNTLYKIGRLGDRTSIGIISGANKCVMNETLERLIITTGGAAYQYDGATLSQLTDADLETPATNAFLNNQVIFDGSGGRFVVATPGDATDIPGLNYASAESAPDDTEAVFVKDQILYLFGERTFEGWYNSGVGNPPMDRIQNAVRGVGVVSPYAITGTTKYTYVLGHDRQVYRINQYIEDSVSSPGIAHIFSGYERVDDVVSYTVEIDGNEIAVFRFESAGVTWAYNENSDTWSRLSIGAEELNYFGHSAINIYNKQLIEDRRNGAIYELRNDRYDMSPEVMIRERVTRPVSGDALQMPGQLLLMDKVKFVVEKGVGRGNGQGESPKIMVSASFDQGNSWTNEDWIDLGEQGESRIAIEWDHTAEFYEAMFKIRLSDPVYLSLHNASIDLTPIEGY